MKYSSILIFLLTYYTVTSAASNDDISLIRERILNWVLWPPQENITETVRTAVEFMNTLNSTCFWPDVIYYDTRLAHWRATVHLYRLQPMVQALTVNGSSLRNDSRLRTAVHCALNAWLEHDFKAANWFDNEIQVPLYLTGQLLMLGDDVTSFEVEKIKEISFRSTWWIPSGITVGANLVWMIQIQIYRSLATNNITGIEQGFTRMWQDVSVKSEQSVGLQHDWSYHFHGRQLLSGAYGFNWAQNIYTFSVVAQHTQYALGQQQIDLLGLFLTQGDAWMINGKNWDWHPIGRAVSRPDKEYFVQFSTEFLRKYAELLSSSDIRQQLNDLADRLDGFSNASTLVGNRHFFASDYHVHRRHNWFTAIKLQSVRTQPIECINVEDQKGEHSGQGVLNLYVGNDYPYDDIFPVLDWQAINGITVEHDINLEKCNGGSFHWESLSFVGGVSDGQYGLAMMDTASHNLTAKRSWHFFDDAIIALASQLAVTTPTTPWTTLASRVLKIGQITIAFFNSTIITINDGKYLFPYIQGQKSNVQWIHVGQTNIAYILQNQQQYASIGIDLGVKTGNYLSIGSFNQSVTERVLTMWIDHGRGPYTSLNYNYMIVPNVSVESVPSIVKQYDEEQVFSCQSTNADFHGVMWPRLKRASFVLWKDMSTTFSCKSALFELNIEITSAGAYLYSENADSFTVTASHPTHKGGNLKVSVDRTGSGEGCTSSWNGNMQSTDITIALPSSNDYIGSSVNVTCKNNRMKFC